MTATEKKAQELNEQIKTQGVTQPRKPEIGTFGKLWIQWMEETQPAEVMHLQLHNSLYTTAEAINIAAKQDALNLADELMEARELPEDPMERAAIVNECRMIAEERVKKLLLQPTTDN